MKNWNDFCADASFFHLTDEHLASIREFYLRMDSALFESMAMSLPKMPSLEELCKCYPDTDDQYKFLFILIASSGNLLRQLYLHQGYPEIMLDEIRYDLRLWADKGMQDYGFAGLTPRLFAWACAVLAGNILQFGRLQCEIPHAFYGNISVLRTDGTLRITTGTETRGGALLNFGDSVINLHIPAAGPLRREACLNSLRRIVEFAGTFRPQYEYRAVVCYSWILDPVWSRWNPQSNLAEFQRLGHLYALPNHEQTDEVVWRVFGGKTRTENLDSVECHTSMQRFVREHIRQGGAFQEYGMFILRDELKKMLA